MDTNYSHIYLILKIHKIEFIMTLCYQIVYVLWKTLNKVLWQKVTEEDILARVVREGLPEKVTLELGPGKEGAG